jgi:hypothetical protein
VFPRSLKIGGTPSYISSPSRICVYVHYVGLPPLVEIPSCPLNPLLQPFKFSEVLRCHSFINSWPTSCGPPQILFPVFYCAVKCK